MDHIVGRWQKLGSTSINLDADVDSARQCGMAAIDPI
jgi:hypothetical protein